MGLLDKRVDYRLGVFAFYSGKQHVASMTFDQGCDLAVVAAEQQVTFPVARYGAILSRSLTDRARRGSTRVRVRVFMSSIVRGLRDS